MRQDFGFYNFSNIRYAQPPLGELRFRAPKPPTGRSETVDDGSVGRICPQALSLWLDVAYAAADTILANGTFDTDGALKNASEAPSIPDPRMNEDCLFLDVVAPKKVVDDAQVKPVNSGGDDGLPVLVWFYPGGYIAGDKTSFDIDRSTFLNTSYRIDPEGVIFVSVNYRVSPSTSYARGISD